MGGTTWETTAYLKVSCKVTLFHQQTPEKLVCGHKMHITSCASMTTPTQFPTTNHTHLCYAISDGIHHHLKLVQLEHGLLLELSQHMSKPELLRPEL